jgi:DNA-directed RNA polymerase subunit alpha
MDNSWWQEFKMPKRLEFDKKTLTNTYGKFFAEPYERGFGVTMGTSLRRLLLSSIQGAAITAVKMEGVYHEFCSIPACLEDVTDIILNLKEVTIKMHSEAPKTLTLKADKAGEITAGDIITDGDVEILNPTHHIATLGDGGVLQMEMIVKKGRGYIPSEENMDESLSVQMIPIDSVFSPVKKVNFEIETTSAGSSVDFERLIMEVHTNGSISPEDAVAHAAKILKEHTQIFINFEEEPEEEKIVEEPEPKEEINVDLNKSVEELELSIRSQNCLRNAEIKTLLGLVSKTEYELLQTKNFGKKSLKEIKDLLLQMGLRLGMKVGNQ